MKQSYLYRRFMDDPSQGDREVMKPEIDKPARLRTPAQESFDSSDCRARQEMTGMTILERIESGPSQNDVGSRSSGNSSSSRRHHYRSTRLKPARQSFIRPARPETHNIPTLTERLGRVLCRGTLAVIGRVGSVIMATLSLSAAIKINGYAEPWIFQALAVTGLLSLVNTYIGSEKYRLSRCRIRLSALNTVKDELRLGVMFLAGCWVFSWPLSYATVGWFFTLNILAQIGLIGITWMGRRTLAFMLRSAQERQFAHRALIIGTGARARELADRLIAGPEFDMKVIGFLDFRRSGLWRYRDIPCLGHPEKFEKVVATTQVDALFMAMDSEDIARSGSLVQAAEEMGVTVYVPPDLLSPRLAKAGLSFMDSYPLVAYRSAHEAAATLFLKVAIDKIGALIGLVLLAPIILITAAMIKLDSRGPVFFKQVRLGLHGKRFYLYKFRTMGTDAERQKSLLMHKNEMSGPVFKIKDDPRITRIGKWLRKYSIDELPQLINVLLGEMSLVGPRPNLPSEVEKFEPWQHRKLAVRPGITCLWQVNGRNQIDFADWIKLDLKYIDEWSLWLDTKILVKTIPAVLKGSGT